MTRMHSSIRPNLSSYRIILMAGYPGSGKSTLAREIATALSGVVVASDAIRERVFQSARYDSRGDAAVSDLREAVYQMVANETLEHAKHAPVVVDATNLEADKRDALIDRLCQQFSRDQLCFVCVRTPRHTIAARMQAPSNTSPQDGESLYDAWERVYGIFEQKEQQHLLSWPNYPDIVTLESDQVHAELASRH